MTEITFLERHPLDVSFNSRRYIRRLHSVVNAFPTSGDLGTERLAGGVAHAHDGAAQLRAEVFILARHHRVWGSHYRIGVLGERSALSFTGLCRACPNGDTEPEDEPSVLSEHDCLKSCQYPSA